MIKNKCRKVCIIMVLIIIFMLQQSIVNAEEKNNNPMLKDIKINGYSIEPEFEMFTTEYVVTVEETIEKVEVEAVPDDENATVNIIGDTNLKLGKNEFKIEVTAENGKNKQVYFVYITKGDSKNANANLKEIKIKDCELAPAFEKNTINYAFEYPKNLEKVEIEAIPEDDNANVEIIGNENLKEVVQNIEIKVTAKDGQTTKTYYLIAKKSGIEVESPEGEEIQEQEMQEQEIVTANDKENNNIIIYILIGILIFIIILIMIKKFGERSKRKNEK